MHEICQGFFFDWPSVFSYIIETNERILLPLSAWKPMNFDQKMNNSIKICMFTFDFENKIQEFERLRKNLLRLQLDFCSEESKSMGEMYALLSKMIWILKENFFCQNSTSLPFHESTVTHFYISTSQKCVQPVLLQCICSFFGVSCVNPSWCLMGINIVECLV